MPYSAGPYLRSLNRKLNNYLTNYNKQQIRSLFRENSYSEYVFPILKCYLFIHYPYSIKSCKICICIQKHTHTHTHTHTYTHIYIYIHTHTHTNCILRINKYFIINKFYTNLILIHTQKYNK